jgi:hypothetical protein
VLYSGDFTFQFCHGLDKLWKWNVVCFGMFVMNDGALRAVKKLYIEIRGLRPLIGLVSPGTERYGAIY